jgi:multidrug resistance efflux pump
VHAQALQPMKKGDVLLEIDPTPYQYNALLERCHLKHDRYTNTVRTVYSLRHTAICMRIILSKGQVNIFNLAKNAGTSVDQIERFYARNLPLSKEMTINLQSFGEKE